MDEKKVTQNLLSFWNDFFKELKPQNIDINDLKISNRLDELLKFLGDNSTRVLDIGTGSGYCLMMSRVFGEKIEYGLGVDPSKNAIDFIKESCKLSKISNLEFLQGDHKYLKNLQDNSFDGIICSNVLDVVTPSTATEIIKEIDRLLKNEGYLLIKINFYLTKELIDRLKMEEIDENTYAINNVLRGVNLTQEQWLDKFPKYDLLESSQYERIKNGPKDRVFLLKKMP